MNIFWFVMVMLYKIACTDPNHESNAETSNLQSSTSLYQIEEYLMVKRNEFDTIVESRFKIKTNILKRRKEIFVKNEISDVEIQTINNLFNDILSFHIQSPKDLKLIIEFFGKSLFILTFSKKNTLLNILETFLLKLTNILLPLHHTLSNELLPEELTKFFLSQLNKTTDSIIIETTKDRDDIVVNLSSRVYIHWTMMFFAMSGNNQLALQLEDKTSVMFIKYLSSISVVVGNELIVMSNIVFLSYSNCVTYLSKMEKPHYHLSFKIIHGLSEDKKKRKNLITFVNAVINYALKIDITKNNLVLINFYVQNSDFRNSMVHYYKMQNEDELLTHLMNKLFITVDYMNYEDLDNKIWNSIVMPKFHPMVFSIYNSYFDNWYSFFLQSLYHVKFVEKKYNKEQIIIVILNILLENRSIILKKKQEIFQYHIVTSFGILINQDYDLTKDVVFVKEKIENSGLYAVDLEDIYRNLLIKKIINTSSVIAETEEFLFKNSQNHETDEFWYHLLILMININMLEKKEIFKIDESRISFLKNCIDWFQMSKLKTSKWFENLKKYINFYE
ncbi:hypothetical protein TCON_1773 [Astathelohania contejeani]|uniref:Uncharacterized protein n=1 Tax=Astathelohania contejeani TaxID=164912 RepID=A0ABQ7HXZ3_9MICR|nr:hypothetical protein TCON_1773 [Thelohania contejeani]